MTGPEIIKLLEARNRYLQAEIEGLRANLNINLDNFASEYDNKIKAEAIKEFAERLKWELAHVVTNVTDMREVVDNLVKEMIGE